LELTNKTRINLERTTRFWNTFKLTDLTAK